MAAEKELKRASGPPAIAVDRLTAGYGGREVLRDLSFTVGEGVITALLGPNGAGKTTLIRSLNGALRPFRGSISVRGKNIEGLSRREIAREIAVVAQENETRFPVTVREFVLSGRFAHGGTFGWESAKDVSAAETSISLCELEEMTDSLMNELSGGERQRVLLARALATEAPVLLLDEPTANLDLSHQALMFRLVRERSKGCGGSAVVITHDLNLASEFADEVLILKDGTAAAHGVPGEVLEKKLLADVFGVDVDLDTNPRTGNVRVTAVY